MSVNLSPAEKRGCLSAEKRGALRKAPKTGQNARSLFLVCVFRECSVFFCRFSVSDLLSLNLNFAPPRFRAFAVSSCFGFWFLGAAVMFFERCPFLIFEIHRPRLSRLGDLNLSPAEKRGCPSAEKRGCQFVAR